jgi:16S rRNA (guanine(1405)-N(7))-methyltransferase
LNKPQADPVDAIIAAILGSAKYRRLAPDLVHRVVSREWEVRREAKTAEQAARRRLHQVTGAYWPQAPRYARWLDELRAAETLGEEAVQTACRYILAGHASTRERLPILSELYRTCLADLAPLHSVLDAACGLNPLASPWMPLAPGARYIACDVYTNLTDFLGQALRILGFDGAGIAVDVLGTALTEPVQVALLMKALPCLEQVDPTAAQALLDALPAEHLLVSFPAHSLGGGKRGMPVNYEAHFRELIASKPWRVQRYLWASELVFRVDKN